MYTPTVSDYRTNAAHAGYTDIEDTPWLAVALRTAARLTDAYVRRSTSPNLADSVKAEAIYCQVDFWKTSDIQPFSAGVKDTPTLSSASLNGGSVSFAGAEQTKAARAAASNELCFESRLILGLAGCNPAPVRVVG